MEMKGTDRQPDDMLVATKSVASNTMPPCPLVAENDEVTLGWTRAPVLNFEEHREEEAGGSRKKALSNLVKAAREGGPIVNVETGWLITITSDACKHVGVSKHLGPAIIRASANLREVLANMLLLHSGPDSNARPGIEQVHRFGVRILVRGEVVSITLTVRRRSREDPPEGLYHLEEKEWRGDDA